MAQETECRAGYLYPPISALKAIGAMETSVGASPGLERLGGLSGGRGWDQSARAGELYFK